MESEQEKNVFEDICESGIILPDDIAEYRSAVADFFDNVPYPSPQIISGWAITNALETLSLTKWSNAVSNREEDLVFCMDYANIQNNEREAFDNRVKYLKDNSNFEIMKSRLIERIKSIRAVDNNAKDSK